MIYYSQKSKITLKEKMPDLWDSLYHEVRKMYDLSIRLSLVHEQDAKEQAICLASWIDQLERLKHIFETVQKDYRNATGRPLFKEIENFRKKQVLLSTAFQLYQEMREVNDSVV